jgi:quinol monooxygenase YgiN
MGCISPDKESGNTAAENIIVLVQYKAQQGKGPDAVAELAKLIGKVEQEPHFVQIKLHVDPIDNTNILLYEEWDDASYYNSEHMNTAHLQEFIGKSGAFLMGPPAISFWKVERTY